MFDPLAQRWRRAWNGSGDKAYDASPVDSRSDDYDSGSEDADDPAARDSPTTACAVVCCDRQFCGVTACCSERCCCASVCAVVLLVPCIVVAALGVVGWSLVSLKANNSNCQNADITPLQFPRYGNCAGCDAGYKSDQELEQCLQPCVSSKFVLDWEAEAKNLGYKEVFFPSRPGPHGEPPVKLAAWWMPPAPRPGVNPKDQPRIVALHGLASNNNHCGVQATCFLLRQMGFGCLAPSVRDFGHSGKSDHPTIFTWGYDYPMDLLGAWDYAVQDPNGVLGGATTADKVGVMGFSKGGLGAAIAFGLEKRIPGAWLDSAPYSGLKGMISAVVRPYVGKWTPLISWIVHWWAATLGGHRIDYYKAMKLLENCSGPPRHVAVSQGTLDTMVPTEEGGAAMMLFSGLPLCYKAFAYTPPEMCNGANHHQEMWEFPDDTRKAQCTFWTGTFNLPFGYCGLESLPHYQLWDPPFNLPPGSPKGAFRL